MHFLNATALAPLLATRHDGAVVTWLTPQLAQAHIEEIPHWLMWQPSLLLDADENKQMIGEHKSGNF